MQPSFVSSRETFLLKRAQLAPNSVFSSQLRLASFYRLQIQAAADAKMTLIARLATQPSNLSVTPQFFSHGLG